MSPPEEHAGNTVRVRSLHLYPVKSLAGIRLQDSELLPTGLPHDREWMLLNHRGRFMTQRDEPRLALIRTRLLEDGVRLSRPGRGATHLPFEPQDGDTLRTHIWQDECEVVEACREASRWLGEALGLDPAPRLVRLAPGARRPQSRPDRYGLETSTLFADAAPYLVVNQASLTALNEALRQQSLGAVPMDRFRPNIVFEGLPAFAEHRVRGLLGAGFALGLAYPCQRCVMITIDQDSAQVDDNRQPWRTLREINPMTNDGREAAFGENAVLQPSSPTPRIRVGQRLSVAQEAS